MKNLLILAVIPLLAAPTARAEECTARADVRELREVHKGAAYNVHFHVSSEDCYTSGCTGYLQYDSRYVLTDGRAYREHHTARYAIKKRESSIDIVDNLRPGQSSQKITVDGVRIKKISCNTPQKLRED
jgi:hypothetical protein